MANPSLIVGDGNWAVKSDSLLGYKTIDGKYYPREFTVTRATTATRVNETGLVQLVPYNLAQYSEQFDNVAWSKFDASITTNTTTAPNGTLTADSFIENTANAQHQCVYQSAAAGGIYTATVYAKPNVRNWLFINVAGASNYGAWFDIQNGVVGTIQSNITSATITSAGNGWYRCIITANTAALLPRISLGLSTGNNIVVYTGDGTSGLFIWGAQLVEGTLPLTYLPTTTRLNIPRVDYSTGSAALLVEPQRTNLAVYSEQFDNASWTKGGSTIIADSIVSPSGVQNADTFNEGTTTNVHSIINYFSISSGVNNTFSVYIKKGTSSYIRISIADNTLSTIWVCAQFNLDTLTFTSGVGSAGGTFISASIVSANNGWYRCILVGNIPITGVGMCIISSSNGVAITSADSRGRATYTGISNTFYLWGAQLEAGSYATSYIPTTAASVTRNTDTITKSNVFTNGYITSAGGTWFVELRNNIPLTRDANTAGLNLDTSLGVDGFAIRNNATATRLTISKYIASARTDLYVTTTNTCKIAIKWNGTTADIFENGIKVVSATAFTTTAMQLINGTSADVTKNINQMALYTTSLTDTECQQLTTL